MALATVFVFIYTKLGGDNTTTFYMISVLLGVAVGYSGAWEHTTQSCSQVNIVRCHLVCHLMEEGLYLRLQYLL